MKTPRVQDFDPNAPIPTLGSPLDSLPGIQKPIVKERENPLPERANARKIDRPSGKRIITRNSFEIYEDQMDSLRRLAYHEKMEGKIGSMSKMVREAIDTFLEKHLMNK